MNEIQKFFEERPSISIQAFCREVGISHTTLHNVKNGSIPLSEKVKSKMQPIIEKYGGLLK